MERTIRSVAEARRLAFLYGVSHRITPNRREAYINSGPSISPAVWGRLRKEMAMVGFNEPGGAEVINRYTIKPSRRRR